MGFFGKAFDFAKDSVVNKVNDMKQTSERLNSYNDEKLMRIVKRAYEDRDMGHLEVMIASNILKERGYDINDVVRGMY